MFDQQFQTIANATPKDQHPDYLVDALAFLGAAQALADKWRATTPTDLTAASTPKDIERLHAEAVAFDNGRESAAQHAATLLALAKDRAGAAWSRAGSDLTPFFAEQFDGAAEGLYAEVERVGGTDAAHRLYVQNLATEGDTLRELVRELDRLAQVRDALAIVGGSDSAGLVSRHYEQCSRFAVFEGAEPDQRWRTLCLGKHEQSRWIKATEVDGMRLKWQTKTQQLAQALPVSVARSQAAMATATTERQNAWQRIS